MTYINLKLNHEELVDAVNNSDMKASMKAIVITLFNAYMEAERDAYVNAKKHERIDDRVSLRNGYYKRGLTMSFGTLELRVPRTRDGEFSTEIFESYQRMDQSLILTIQEAVINGVSHKKIEKLLMSLCGEKISKQTVSTIMKRLEPEIQAFKGRKLHFQEYRYVYVDAMYIKVREHNKVVSKAVYIAQGINADNKREIIGFMVSDEESKSSWTTFFRNLRDRGLVRPKMIISDAHKGLVAAIQEEFVGTKWQRCTFHFLRNLTDVMPKKDSSTERQALKRIFTANTRAHADMFREEFEMLVQDNPKYEDALKRLDAGFEDAMQYITEPEAYHKSLRTTNSLERINQEIRRRERVVRIFPTTASAELLIGSVLLDIHEEIQKRDIVFLKD